MKNRTNILSESLFNNRKKFFPDISDNEWHNPNWQIENSITDYGIISNLCELPNFSDEIQSKYPMRITPYFFCLMNHKNGYDDPIFKQVIPNEAELIESERELQDPFAENQGVHSPLKGVVRRYPDRIIIVTTPRCFSLCRYCTRKWNWNENEYINSEDLEHIIDYLKDNPSIREVLITGGDPFLMAPDYLDSILNAVYSVKSIEVIRIGTRVLSFLPYMVTDRHIEVINKYYPIWIMTHFNHINEFTPDTMMAIKKLSKAGASLCNQSVLLNGVNNTHEDIKNLNYALIKHGVKPYYLFYPDPVLGTGYFTGSIEQGLSIMSSLNGQCSGLSIPQFIVDTPTGGKVRMSCDADYNMDENSILLKTYKGDIVKYKF